MLLRGGSFPGTVGFRFIWFGCGFNWDVSDGNHVDILREDGFGLRSGVGFSCNVSCVKGVLLVSYCMVDVGWENGENCKGKGVAGGAL